MGWIALYITEAKKITLKYYCYGTSSSILFCTVNNDDIKITDAFVTSTNRTSHTAAWLALNGRPLIFHCVQMETTVNQVNKRTAMTATIGNTSFLSFFFTFSFFFIFLKQTNCLNIIQYYLCCSIHFLLSLLSLTQI